MNYSIDIVETFLAKKSSYILNYTNQIPHCFHAKDVCVAYQIPDSRNPNTLPHATLYFHVALYLYSSLHYHPNIPHQLSLRLNNHNTF